MSPVEAEIRRLLRWFPASWRRSHAEALVGTLLDATDADRRERLTDTERRDLLVSGLCERGLALVPGPVRERAAGIALGVGTVLATAQLVGLEWAPRAVQPAWTEGTFGFGPFISAGALVDLLWLIAFFLGLARLRRAMIVTLGASVIVSVLLVLLPESAWTLYRPPAFGLLVMGLLAAAACIGPLHARRHTVVAAGLSALALTIALGGPFPAWGLPGTRTFFWRLDPTVIGVIIAAVALVLILVRQRGSAEAVLVGLAPAWVILLLRSTAFHDVVAGIAGLLAALVVVSVVGVLSRFRLRFERLPQSR